MLERVPAVLPTMTFAPQVARPGWPDIPRSPNLIRHIGLGVASIALLGCSHLQPLPATHYVYVTAKQTYLRDRVAAVSNRTATVANGDRLRIVQHARRFYQVKTEHGEEGWIDEKQVATQPVFDEFESLQKAHAGDPAVASAVVELEVNLHLKPGRDTERFYRLTDGEKVQLLSRAALLKPVSAGVLVPRAGKPSPSSGKASPAAGADGVQPPAPPPLEDWWLVRDSHGHVGWMLSRMLEVDTPESLTRYAESQRFVGAYVLTTVHDDHVDGDNKEVPVYLTVLSPPVAGLPYDFDQVRVFTWNTKVHRYETGFRDKNIEGYLPVSIKIATDPYGKSVAAQTPEPTFTYKVLAADAGPVVPDPVTGTIKPGDTIEKTYRLEGNLVRRVVALGATKDEAHPVYEEKKKKERAKKKK